MNPEIIIEEFSSILGRNVSTSNRKSNKKKKNVYKNKIWFFNNTLKQLKFNCITAWKAFKDARITNSG